jgi:hypothetical protein
LSSAVSAFPCAMSSLLDFGKNFGSDYDTWLKKKYQVI